jgi:hypothetical protein
MSPKRTPMSEIEALLRGAAEGGSFGFSGELAGVAAQLDEFGKRLGGAVPTDMGEAYGRSKGETQALLQQAEEEHPGFAYGGQLAGALLVPIPGAAEANALARSGQLAKAAQAAALGHAATGALSGLGRSEATTAGGLAKDIVSDAALSSLAGGAAQRYGPTMAAKLREVVRNSPSITQRLGRRAEAAGDYVERGAAKAASMLEPGVGLESAQAVPEAPAGPVDFFVVRDPNTGQRIIVSRRR